MEEIIIDGVDVSECEHRNDIYRSLLADGVIKEFSNYCYISNDGCYGINCYYKQLLQKEKEIEELKLANSELIMRNADIEATIVTENNHLQEENKELKKEIEELESDTNKPPKERFYCRGCSLPYYEEKYKQAIDKIKEIISEPCISGENCSTCNSECMQKDILQIINEVEE